ncbi:hypothetical protein Bca52824_066170 [Brassica carinata]|uniref:Uncharacterized protein n=1 Tax=Brassica carinata TaxID=52824 RepID=A0A8X7QNH2_BRACI|nr:hypothetical protein Bca52824_066170 [Brassica carinata]
MSGDSVESVPGEIRPALRNLTNLQKKRGASSISSDSLEKSGDDGCSRVEFSKRLCVVVDDLVKQNGSSSSSSSDSKCSSKRKHLVMLWWRFQWKCQTVERDASF